MGEKITLSYLRERLITESLKDLWWLAKNGVTYPTPMSLQSIELTLKRNPQGSYQVCHVRDDGELGNNWKSISAASVRKVESRGNTTIFRAGAPIPAGPPRLRTPAEDQGNAGGLDLLAQEAMSRKLDDVIDRLRRVEDKVERLLETRAVDEEQTDLDQLRAELDKLRFRLESA